MPASVIHVSSTSDSSEKVVRFSLSRKSFAALMVKMARGRSPSAIRWESCSTPESSFGVDVALLVAGHDAPAAVEWLIANFQMSAHSEVGSGRLEPGEDLESLEQMCAEAVEPTDSEEFDDDHPNLHIASGQEGNGKIIRFRISSKDSLTLASWLGSPKRPHLDWQTDSDCFTCHDVDVTLFVGLMDVSPVLEDLKRLEMTMRPHFDILFDIAGPSEDPEHQDTPKF